jgi:hypothetical protein
MEVIFIFLEYLNLMQQYNQVLRIYRLELEIYNNYRNNSNASKDNISRLDGEIDKRWKEMIDLMSDSSFMNKRIGVV